MTKDGKWLYFSSNKAGHYHIWRLDLQSGEYRQLTQGIVTDIHPAIDQEGNLYFTRYSPAGTQLLKLTKAGELEVLNLPDSATDVRDMEISL